MYYSNYLIHFNQNHSSKNGQFTSGDGDGDGIRNDHANARKNTNSKNSSAHTSGSSKAGKTMLNGKNFISGVSSMSVDGGSESSAGAKSYGGGGGGASDPETEEQKKRRSLRYQAIMLGIQPEYVEGWIDQRIDSEYKMWDLAYDRVDVLVNPDGSPQTYVDEEGYTRARTRKHRNPMLDNYKTNHDSEKAKSAGFNSRRR